MKEIKILQHEQLKWLRNNLRLGNNYVFASMERVSRRIKVEQKQYKEQLNDR